LNPLELRLQRRTGPLLPQIEAALAPHGRVLRWAVTAVETPMDKTEPAELLIEAVVLV
jgi:hypothetical protein